MAAAAIATVAANGKEHSRRLERLKPFKCPEGDHWHAGHSAPPRNRRRGKYAKHTRRS
jgi:hypothetical protein